MSRLFTVIRKTIYGLHGTAMELRNIPEINRTVPDTISNLADDCGETQVVDVISRDDLEPNCIIVVKVLQALK